MEISNEAYNDLLRQPILSPDEAHGIRTFIFAGESHEDRQKRYRKYLKSNHWSTFRQAVIKARGGICEKCSIDTTGNTAYVRHITFKRVGMETMDDVTLVCSKCHGGLYADSNAKDTNQFKPADIQPTAATVGRRPKGMPRSKWRSIQKRTQATPTERKAYKRPKGMPRTLWKTEQNEMRYRHKAKTFPYGSVQKEAFFERNPHLRSPQI